MFLLGAVNTLSKRRGAAFADGWGGERDATRVTRERDARGTPRSLSRARVMSPRDGMARARRGSFRRVRAVLLTLVAAIALGRARAEDDETVAMGEDGVSVREAALGGNPTSRWGANRGIASLNAKRIHYRPSQEEAALGRGRRSEVGGGNGGAEISSDEFARYLRLHGKTKQTYCRRREGGVGSVRACELMLRRAVANFRRNQRIVMRHNADAHNTFKLRMNKFADIDLDDFHASQYNYKARPLSTFHFHHQRMKRLTLKAANGMLGRSDATKMAFPKNFNWKDVPNVMGRVHNQRQDCASCWAYVTTDILESLRVIKNFSRVHEELAVDELINCDTYDSGCATGNMFTAFEWIETEGGITTNHHFGSLLDGLSGKPKSWFANTLKTRGDEKDEADAYGVKPEAHFEATPHLEPGVTLNAVQDQMCSAVTRNSWPRVAQVYGYCELSLAGGEKELMHALSKSPVAIGLNANKKFQLYDSGILRMSDCPPAPHTSDTMYTSINHAALLTGWGEETMPNGEVVKYWVVKNSFGEDWGEDGYFRLERGPVTSEGLGTCGMYFESVYPIVDEDEGSSRRCIPGAMYRTDYYRAMFGLTAQEGRKRTNFFSSDRETSDATRVGIVIVCGTVIMLAVSKRLKKMMREVWSRTESDTPLLNAQNN